MGKITEKAVRKSILSAKLIKTVRKSILSAKLIKTHFFRRFCPLGIYVIQSSILMTLCISGIISRND